MFIKRFYDDRLAQASYLIGCQQTGEAIVIDPSRDVEQYLAGAKKEGLRVTRVTETHIHADFVSGTRELAAASGAKTLLSGEGGADWQYGFAKSDNAELLHDGDVITMGGVQIDVMHTPGHTPEHLSFVITDMARSPEPIGLISGDFVFVGDVGRPDLLDKVAGASGTQEAGAAALHDSLQKLKDYPDYMQIWPGHGAGSACGKALGALPASTLGYERRTNWAFRAPSRDAFVATVLDGQPSPPNYFATMKQVNRDGPDLLGAINMVPSLTAAELPAALRDGDVIDLRPLPAFTKAHLPGSLSTPMGGAFLRWAGAVLRPGRDIYIVSPDAASAEAARQALSSIGFDRVRGVFSADVVAAAEASGTAAHTEQTSITNVDALAAEGRTIVDVREPNEWNAGHFDNAISRPMGGVAESMADLDRSTPIALHCQGGTRSAITASLLEKMGFTDVRDLTGGWEGRRKS